MNARIDGKLQLKILPGFDLIVNDLNLINNEIYILRTETAEFALDFKSYFLGQEVLITAIRLRKPQVFIFEDENGKFNFEPSAEINKNQVKPLKFKLNDISIADGRLLYFDQGYEDTLLISGINLSSGLIKAEGDFENFQLNKYALNGKIGINEFQLNAMRIQNLLLNISLANGRISISPDKTAFYGGTLSGNSVLDLSGEAISASMNYHAENVKIDSLLMDFETPLYLKGKVNIEADLKFESFSWGGMKQSVQGSIALSGENVLVYGFNSDVVIDNFEKTEKFSVINAGAALMAGPVGAIFTDDKSLSALLANDCGDSLMAKKFMSEWKLSQGSAMAEDVAFSDGNYRINVAGNIDFQKRTYNNLSISLLNGSGCPVISQQIDGTFLQPVFNTISTLNSKTTLKEELSNRKNCTSAYSGSITLP